MMERGKRGGDWAAGDGEERRVMERWGEGNGERAMERAYLGSSGMLKRVTERGKGGVGISEVLEEGRLRKEDWCVGIY